MLNTWEWLSLLSWVDAGPVDNKSRPSNEVLLVKGGSDWAIMCTVDRLVLKT